MRYTSPNLPKYPARTRDRDNAKVGFMLGFDEGVIGCWSTFPPRKQRVRMRMDCNNVETNESDAESLHFTENEEISNGEATSDADSDHEYDTDLPVIRRSVMAKIQTP
ncbi:hypothetical protein PsorP6_001978 [Peronosclerospora sorghi]|uniref:Uncharacterized protein n=1 Tax=Peronosclerospora sorghi TaxID=230839 RepID=A0ACC0WW46_9STRA|nr:hypothetical protein PsorP6_001978 [Peronosclerospora sorghi]